MKVLLDTCVWGGARDALTEAGHEVEWVGDWPSDPGDTEILKVAAETDRILVTLDKDFGELAVVRRQFHRGIVRLVNLQAREQGTVCVNILSRFGTQLKRGAIVTVENERVRIRPATPE